MGDAEAKITAAEAAGGVPGYNTLRAIGRAGHPNLLRIDIVIQTPNINIVY